MNFAYADPPYKGQAKKYYGAESSEVQFEPLIGTLDQFDGWGLSCHVNQLKDLLPFLPVKARIMAWFKPFVSFKKGVNPCYAWEPVIIKPGRKPQTGKKFIFDWVCCAPQMRPIIMGQKPLDFCYWLFEVMGCGLGDNLDDLYPGSNQVSYAWKFWQEHFNFEQQKPLTKQRPL